MYLFGQVGPGEYGWPKCQNAGICLTIGNQTCVSSLLTRNGHLVIRTRTVWTLKCFHFGSDVHEFDRRHYMSRPVSTTRLLLMIAALTNPFCWLPCITAAKSAWANLTTGDVRGTKFITHSGGKSPASGAVVSLTGPSLSQQVVSDQQRNYTFASIVPDSYQIDVKAPGLIGSDKVTVVSRAARDVPVQLKSK
jgi:hypothetical protein